MRPEDSVGMPVGARIEMAPYSALWPLEFERVAAELREACGEGVLSVEHVGSTAIPGLCAKPIIDILVGVVDLAASLDLRPALERLGFVSRPDDELPDRHYFPRTVAGLRLHHVSLAEPDSRHYRNSVAFRDALRRDPALATEYGELKLRLAREAGVRRLEYLNGKTAFILHVLESVGAELGGDYPTEFGIGR